MKNILAIIILLISLNLMAGATIPKGTVAETLPAIDRLTFGVLRSGGIQSGAVDPTIVAIDGNKGAIYQSSTTGEIYVKSDSGLTTNWVAIQDHNSLTGIQGGAALDHYHLLNSELLYLQSLEDNLISAVDGTLTASVANYETLVTSDNVITNKKYVDDAIAASTTTPTVATDSTIEGDGSSALPLSVSPKGGDNNLVSNGNFSTDIAGWTASSANIAIARNTSSPTHGVADAIITVSTSATTSDYIQYGPINLDSGDQKGVMKLLEATYFTGGGFVDGTLGAYLHDGTNYIYPADQAISATTSGKINKMFQLPFGVAPIYMRFKVDAVPASSATMQIDDVFLGEKAVVRGAPIIDLGEFTPTLSSGFGTITSGSGRAYRIGSRLKVDVRFSVASNYNSTTAYIDLPFGLSVGNEVSNSSSMYGRWTKDESGDYNSGELFSGTSVDRTKLYFGYPTSASGGTTQPFVFIGASTITNPNSTFLLTFEVPIAGWSSNMVLSEDAGNRRIAVYGDGNNGISIDSSTDITFTEVEDTTSSWSGSSLTAPESGDYLVFGSVNTTSGTFNSYIRAYINGNADKVLYRGNSSIGTAAFAGLVSLQKDQVLSIRTSGAFTLLNESKFHWISIHKLASPQTIAASEVQSGFANTDGVATGSFGSGFVKAIKWDNIIDDTHSALNTTTGIITSRRNGKLTLNISSMWTSSTAWSEGGRSDIYIYVGGVQVKSKLEEVYYATASDATYVTVETSLIGYPVKIGDEIYVNIQQTSGAALSLFPSPTYNTIGWEIK